MMFLQGRRGQRLEARGYATLFNAPVRVAYNRCELFLPGAFAATLRKRSAPVRVTVNHCDAHRFDAPTLDLWEDAIGLAFAFPVPATWPGHALARYMAEGTAAASITFHNLSARQDGEELHSIALAKLDEMCITAWPAMPTAAWLSDHVADDLPIEAARLWRSWTAGRARRAAEVKSRQERQGKTLAARMARRERGGGQAKAIALDDAWIASMAQLERRAREVTGKRGVLPAPGAGPSFPTNGSGVRDGERQQRRSPAHNEAPR